MSAKQFWRRHLSLFLARWHHRRRHLADFPGALAPWLCAGFGPACCPGVRPGVDRASVFRVWGGVLNLGLVFLIFRVLFWGSGLVLGFRGLSGSGLSGLGCRCLLSKSVVEVCCRSLSSQSAVEVWCRSLSVDVCQSKSVCRSLPVEV